MCTHINSTHTFFVCETNKIYRVHVHVQLIDVINVTQRYFDKYTNSTIYTAVSGVSANNLIEDQAK